MQGWELHLTSMVVHFWGKYIEIGSHQEDQYGWKNRDMARQLDSQGLQALACVWNVQALDEHFYDKDKEAILNIPLSSRIEDDF